VIKRHHGGVADRLRELIDLVLESLDEPGADGRALAELGAPVPSSGDPIEWEAGR